MTEARKIDGTAIAKAIRERIGSEIAEKQKAYPRYIPCLKIVQGMCMNVLVCLSLPLLTIDAR